jgi:hypothetical protein
VPNWTLWIYLHIRALFFKKVINNIDEKNSFLISNEMNGNHLQGLNVYRWNLEPSQSVYYKLITYFIPIGDEKAQCKIQNANLMIKTKIWVQKIILLMQHFFTVWLNHFLNFFDKSFSCCGFCICFNIVKLCYHFSSDYKQFEMFETIFVENWLIFYTLYKIDFYFLLEKLIEKLTISIVCQINAKHSGGKQTPNIGKQQN